MKTQLKSKTNWLGIAITAVSVFTLVSSEPWIQEYPRIVAGLGVFTGVLTVVIRQFTSERVR